jgi:hypothetical protein
VPTPDQRLIPPSGALTVGAGGTLVVEPQSFVLLTDAD